MIRLFKIIGTLLGLLLCGLLGFNTSFAAEAILNVDAKTTQVDLAPYRTPIAAERDQISIQGPGDARPLELKAKGPGPTFYWSLYSFNALLVQASSI